VMNVFVDAKKLAQFSTAGFEVSAGHSGGAHLIDSGKTFPC